MSIGAFVEKDHPPTRKALERVLGAKQALFEQLAVFMDTAYHLKGEWTYGGKKYGWNIWYRKSGKTLLNLFPQKGGPVAQVVLGREQVQKASALTLGAHVQDVFSRTPQFHDGRWLFIPVRTRRDVKDVQDLVQLKRKPDTGEA
jgi:hypothetical protein